MSNPRLVREALQTRLRSITGLTVYGTWPNQPQAPCAILAPSTIEYSQTLGRGDLAKLSTDCTLLVSLAGGYENANDNLDPYLATSSTGGVFGAIIADPTLGGVVSTTFIRAMSGYQQYEIGPDLAYMGAVISLESWST